MHCFLCIACDAAATEVLIGQQMVIRNLLSTAAEKQMGKFCR